MSTYIDNLTVTDVCGVAAILGLALILVRTYLRKVSAETALKAALERANKAEGKLVDADTVAQIWYILSPLRHLIRDYGAAIEEWEHIANGKGDEEDYAPDRQHGGARDFEGQELDRCETALAQAALLVATNPANSETRAAIANTLEMAMERMCGSYRRSLHRVLRESWVRVIDQVAGTA